MPPSSLPPSRPHPPCHPHRQPLLISLPLHTSMMIMRMRMSQCASSFSELLVILDFSVLILRRVGGTCTAQSRLHVWWSCISDTCHRGSEAGGDDHAFCLTSSRMLYAWPCLTLMEKGHHHHHGGRWCGVCVCERECKGDSKNLSGPLPPYFYAPRSHCKILLG